MLLTGPGRGSTSSLLAVIGLLCCPPASPAQTPKDEPLPPPRTVPQAEPVYVLPPVFVRPSRYDVWQYHAPDRRGRFRPVVVASPYGPYYLLTGKPYPFAMLHSLDWLPYASH